ncbi:MAG: hypothetical protein JW784_04685 [Candidatus Cloacimonetes bacterium]|nr:hypothetical protein [Candidatus Cloacimonadota bacterium]
MDKERQTDPVNTLVWGVSLGLALGAAAGVVTGMLTKDIALWPAIGIGGGLAIGAGVGGILEYRKRK